LARYVWTVLIKSGCGKSFGLARTKVIRSGLEAAVDRTPIGWGGATFRLITERYGLEPSCSMVSASADFRALMNAASKERSDDLAEIQWADGAP
jgi:hypothetical protein